MKSFYEHHETSSGLMQLDRIVLQPFRVCKFEVFSKLFSSLKIINQEVCYRHVTLHAPAV